MKTFVFQVYLFIFILGITYSYVFAQTKIEFSHLSNLPSATVDLSEKVKKQCNMSIFRTLKNSKIEIKFSETFSKEAQQVLLTLENSLLKTQEILSPLQTENIRFYLYQTSENIDNYKMNDQFDDDKTYLHLWIFKDISEIKFESLESNNLAENIFQIIPHEITHGAIENLISQKELKWFDEGLAEYVANEVLKSSINLSKEQEQHLKILPKLMLNQAVIRSEIWSWKKRSKNLLNNYNLYQASLELIRLIIEKAKQNRIINPLKTIFEKLKELKKTNNKDVDNEKLFNIIQNLLNIEIKTLGILSNEEKENFVSYALEIIYKKDTPYTNKYLPFLILANLSDIKLSDISIFKLLEELYLEKENKPFISLISKALKERFNEPCFNKNVERFLQNNPNLNQKSIKEIKNHISNLSIKL
jgi:hypothetical protein